MIDKKQKEALDNALKMINKKYGDEAVMKMNDIPKMMPSISTGSLGLDIALGIGGVPQGRIIEIYGPESSGKTTLTLQIIREAQKINQVAAFIDAEHALDPKYAKSLGVNMDDLIVSQPDCGEQAMDIVETLIDSSAINLIVVDSVAALTPKKELEGEMGDANVGLQARLMSQALRKITSKAKQNNVTVVFINQIRMKIGVMFGSPETTTGGNALKFYSSVRMDIRRTGSVKDGDEVIGNETKVKVVKNKIAPPFKETHFEILYGSGVDNYGEVLDYATKMELVQKSGAWYSCNGEKIGQGKVKTVAYLKENKKLFDELNKKIRDKYLNLEAIEKASSQNTETDSDFEVADE